MTKMIVLVALLTAVGCSKKGSDCDAAIAKGMANLAAQHMPAANSQGQDRVLSVVSKLKGSLTQRCTEDKWPSEAVSCFSTIAKMKDMRACQAKMNPKQGAKFLNEVQEIVSEAMGSVRMPSDVAGHPPMLSGSGDPGAGGTGGSAAPAGSPTPAPAATPAGSSAAPAGSAAPAAGGW